MMILIVIYGSPYSQKTVGMLKALKLPHEIQVVLIE